MATQTYLPYQPEAQEMVEGREQDAQVTQTSPQRGSLAPPASWTGR